MENNSSIKKVLSAFMWKFSERILAQVVSFVVSVVLARIMMPEQYGIVAMVTVFINIANVFVTSGFSTALIQKKDASETDFSTIFWCTFGISLVLYLVMFALAPWIAQFYNEPQLKIVVRVFSFKLIISSYNSIQHAYVSRNMMFKKFFYSTLFGILVSGIVGIVMALMGFGVWALVFQYLINSCVDTLVLAFTIPWHLQRKFSVSAAKELMSYGWKILVADLVGTIYNNLRQLLIGKVYSSSDLAFYNKGKQIPELISTNVDTTVTTVLFPAMANEHDDPVKIKYMTKRSVSFSSYIMFPLMLGLAAIAKPLIQILLTDKWNASIIYLQIICIAKAISTVSNANLQAMKAIGRSDVVLSLELKKKPIGILMIFLALRVNVLAVAITMPLYALYAAAVNMKPNKQLLNYSFKEQIQDLMPATSLSILMFCAITSLNYHVNLNNVILVFADVMLGGAIYLGLSYLFKVESFRFALDATKNFKKKK
jgi:O-antigen/teichoic acid export membrane protein